MEANDQNIRPNWEIILEDDYAAWNYVISKRILNGISCKKCEADNKNLQFKIYSDRNDIGYHIY